MKNERASQGRHVYTNGLIGNCAYLAQIDARARVVWLCWPRFDSDPVFGELVGGQACGAFSVEPASEGARSTQYYLENTNVLCTEFDCVDGRFRVLDWAPRFHLHERYFKPLMLMRKIERIQGDPRVRVCCNPTGGFGSIQPRASLGSNHIRYLGLKAPLRLTTNVSLHRVLASQPFVLTKDRHLALSWGPALEAPLEDTVERFLRSTIAYWHQWVLRCRVPSFRPQQVIRSALALKLHQFEDTGALIAASTTSLPEAPGEGRNWDYRYCWLRDAYYTLSAFLRLGHAEEVQHFAEYIRQAVAVNPGRVQPVYGINGEAKLVERLLDALPGYRGNTPVRVGNEAYTHIQNDAYGQVLLSLLPLYVDPRMPARERLQSTQLIAQLLDMIEETMNEDDAGLWELRTSASRHCYTFLFHWAGAQGALRIAEALDDAALMARARGLVEAAARQIEACYDEARGTYGHAIGSELSDASLLKLINMGYLDPSSDRASRLIEQIQRDLSPAPGHLYRYRHADDFGVPAVAFMICGFWLVEAQALTGRLDEAIESFDALLACGNHVGLLSEDADPRDGSQWGNFPQTYSHVGVINAAFRIARELGRPMYLDGDPRPAVSGAAASPSVEPSPPVAPSTEVSPLVDPAPSVDETQL